MGSWWPIFNYLNVEHGWKSWLFTTDHKRIAFLYLISITLICRSFLRRCCSCAFYFNGFLQFAECLCSLFCPRLRRIYARRC